MDSTCRGAYINISGGYTGESKAILANYLSRKGDAFFQQWLAPWLSITLEYSTEYTACEAGSLSQDAGAEMARICQVLSTYAPQDIYNCDETSLYWRKIPGRSLSTRPLPGRKKDKARISVLFCYNSDASERIPIWFIGTARRPKAFVTAGINIENLGCVWRSNKKAWMTREIFKEWLIWFDKKMAGRKVVLLLDNFSAHEAAFRDIGPQLQNTLVI